VNITNAIIVNLPLVATLKSCGPLSKYWLNARSNVTAPVPTANPAVALYTAVDASVRPLRFANVESCARPGTSVSARWLTALTL